MKPPPINPKNILIIKPSSLGDVVRALLAAEAAVVVHDGRELTAFVRRMITSPAIATQMGHRAQSLVQSQKGATQATATLFAEEMFGLGRQKAA